MAHEIESSPADEPLPHVDNSRVRVTTWRFAPGAQTGRHQHEYDYVVVPMMDGLLRIETPDGSVSEVPLRRGEPYFRLAGVDHNVINASGHDFEFIEVEIR